MIAQIKAIQFDGAAAFNPEDVGPWMGTDAGSAAQIDKEVFQSSRDRVARVLYVSDQTTDLADGQIQLTPTFRIIVGVKVRRTSEARRGSDDAGNKQWGTNAMVDLLKRTFNQKRPNLTDGIDHTDKTQYLGAQIEFLDSNKCVMSADVTVDVMTSGA